MGRVIVKSPCEAGSAGNERTNDVESPLHDMKVQSVDPIAPTVAVVIVAYASKSVLKSCVQALSTQSRRPDAVVVIDNNSPDPAYLAEIPHDKEVEIIRSPVNEGFCGANNEAFRRIRHHKYIVFLNPDAFPLPDLIERAVEWMEQPSQGQVGILTGTLLGFDIVQNRPTGAIDSTGVFQTWYGKWYDRDQGKPWRQSEASASAEDVPAITGALMFCRSEALESVLSRGGDVFDRNFFMYKEDIDLSLRLRKRGWRLVYWPTLICYHCRGWRGRDKMSGRARYLSARNEVSVSLRNGGRGLAYSALKFAFVPFEYLYLRSRRFIAARD